MTVLSAQVDAYRRSAGEDAATVDLAESIDVGLKLYDALRAAVERAERRGINEADGRRFHAMAGELAEIFGELLRRAKGAPGGGAELGDVARLEEAWRDFLPAMQFTFDRLNPPAGGNAPRQLKSAGEVRDGLRGQVHGRG